MGQSPFALARGGTFERFLFYPNADRLIRELIAKEVLPERSNGLLDLRLRMNGGPLATLDEAMSETRAFLATVASARTAGDTKAPPAVIAGAAVRIPQGVMLPEAILIIDVLAVVQGGDRTKLVVGEVKTYPDRAGYTDKADLALARAQAGIYVHALDVVVSEMSLIDDLEIDRSGFLVLTQPGSNFPSVRVGEDLRYQAERARRGFDLLELAAQGLPPFDRAVDDAIESVTLMEASYSEACLSFCDRASKCHADALARNDPVILGDDAARFFGEINLARAVELSEGVEPKSSAEVDLLRRIRETETLLGYG
jgi:hypothetical protein